jgi:carbon monoxide dehydrogenase subunit G
MTRFTAETRAVAVITAPRSRIWGVLTDPDQVAELTPFVRRITADGDHWRWELSGLKVAGIGLAPTFTERMTYDEPRRIDFRPDPAPDVSERAGVEGWYALDEADGGSRLETSLAISVDLPLPRVSGGAVRSAMQGVVAQMGDRFSANLLARLGAEQVA